MVQKKILIIIQARIGSSRLPGKVLKKILGKPILWHIVNRLSSIKNKKIVVATSKSLKDKKIINFCKKNELDYFVGSEKNVLDRFYKAAIKFKASNIVRITGDCPLIDAKIIKRLINFYFSKKFDHVGVTTGAGVNKIKINKFPDGLDAECFSFLALKKAWSCAKTNIDKEHVTPYIWKRNKKFKIGILKAKNNYSEFRWTLDNRDDFDLINIIYKNLYKKNKIFYMDDIIKFLKKNPNISDLNKKHIGKERYKDI
ncbi:glycosyltransferase family protein [Candidatus Pelagibacter sp.]|nr:glycosyltransferase family protein [Candidatus Pelagibacter sp.]